MSNKNNIGLVSERTKKLLALRGVLIIEEKPRKEVSKKKYKTVYGNYNLLEHLGFATKFLCKKYNVDRHTIDLLCFLYPKEVFTLKDYRSWPGIVPNVNLKILLDKELLSLVGGNQGQSIYMLSNKSKIIVELLHKYLLDFTKMPRASFEINGNSHGKKLSAMINKLKNVQ